MIRDAMRERETFRDVLLNSDDQVAVRTILLEAIPASLQDEIVRQFNLVVRERNRIREEFMKSVCPRCGGDGYERYFAEPNTRCEHCDGEGIITTSASAAGSVPPPI